MSDDVEQILRQLAPRGPEVELRQRVLGTVGRELATAGPLGRWERRLAFAVAVSIVLGIALNAWIAKVDNGRRARLFGPPPVPRQITEIAEAVRSVTDEATGEWVQQQLYEAWQSRSALPPKNVGGFQAISNDFKTLGGDEHNENEVDRLRRRRDNRDTSDC